MSTPSLLMHARHGAVLRGATRSHLVARARAVLRMLCLLGSVAGVLLGTAGVAHAQSAADPAADLGPLTQRWLDDALARNQSSALPLRMEVSVG